MAAVKKRISFRNGVLGVSFSSLSLLVTSFFLVCNSGQINSSSFDSHPVAKVPSETLHHTTTVPLLQHVVIKNNRNSSRRSLSTPISIPTISNAKRVVEAVNHTSSLGKLIVLRLICHVSSFIYYFLYLIPDLISLFLSHFRN